MALIPISQLPPKVRRRLAELHDAFTDQTLSVDHTAVGGGRHELVLTQTRTLTIRVDTDLDQWQLERSSD